jgi:hypothetical protein
MAVRLLAGQDAKGGWTYNCPAISTEEQERLNTLVRAGKDGDRRDPPGKDRKRTVRDLAPQIQEQLTRLNAVPPVAGRVPGDNSNTQFAILALWIAHRHGIPVATALTRVDARFRSTQNADLGWSYLPRVRGTEDDEQYTSSATMTCVGVLALALVHGAVAEAVAAREPKVRPRDPAKDASLLTGLAALSTTIAKPGPATGRLASPGGKFYYYLWSLERVCVALDIETLYTKEWYAWGCEFLLANQTTNGTWRGTFADCGADTCFALLFLRRANLLRELSTEFKGKLKGLGERALHTGIGIKPPAKLKGPMD